MRWDVDTCRPSFVNMKQLSLHVKVWAHDNILDEMPNVEPRSISFYHTDCDSDIVKKFQVDIKQKYGKNASCIFDKTMLTPTNVKVQTGIRKRTCHDLPV